jgi:hypothetical protein
MPLGQMMARKRTVAPEKTRALLHLRLHHLTLKASLRRRLPAESNVVWIAAFRMLIGQLSPTAHIFVLIALESTAVWAFI